MNNPINSAILVVGHGSRRQEANDDVREAARRIGQRGRFMLVEAAFLEIEHPNIRRGIYATGCAWGAGDYGSSLFPLPGQAHAR